MPASAYSNPKLIRAIQQRQPEHDIAVRAVQDAEALVQDMRQALMQAEQQLTQAQLQLQQTRCQQQQGFYNFEQQSDFSVSCMEM